MAASRRSQPPRAEEQEAIEAEIDSNVQAIALMKEKMENGRRNAKASVVNCTKMLTQAELLLEAATAFKNALSTTSQSIKDTFIAFNPAIALSDPGDTNDLGTEMMAQCSKPPDIAAAIQYAANVHLLAVKRLQAALVERDTAESSANEITTSISTLIQANREKRRRLGFNDLHGLPPEIWADIFAEATLPDRESPSIAGSMPPGWIHGSRAMLLASVCGDWRSVAINTRALWSTISLAPAKQDTDFIAGLVELHLTRMGPLPCDLTIRLDEEIEDYYFELMHIFSRVKCLRQLYFCFHSTAREYVSDLYSMIPTPSKLVLEITDTGFYFIISLPLAEPALKSLKLISCGLLETVAAPLTHFEVEQKGGSYSDIGKWTMREFDTLEHVILRYRNANVAPETTRYGVPHLRYLETSTSMLANRIMHIWNMPNLQELVIIDAEEYDNQRWEQFTTRLGSEARLETLTVDSIVSNVVQELVGSLTTLSTVMTLELRGKNVDAGLEKLKWLLEKQASQIPNLQTLVITDYVGGGDAILDIIASIQIETVNCPNFSREVIQALLLQRQGF